MFLIHFVYICLHFLNIYFIDSVRFQESVRILFTFIEHGHFLNIYI